MSRSQLKKLKKRQLQAIEAKRVLEYLLQSIDTCLEDPHEIDALLEKLSKYIRKFSTEKDNSRFKNLIAFSHFYHYLHKDRNEKILREIQKNKSQKRHWKDFEAEILEMHENGKSNAFIASMIKERGVKCNRESIRQYLLKYNKEK